jgi:NAD(P) transhydrogenase
MLAAAGSRVTLVDGRDRLLDFCDGEITENLQFRMREMGIRLRLGEKVDHIDVVGQVNTRRKGDNADGPPPHVVAHLESGKAIAADCLLYCIGRQGATDALNLEAANLAADKRGRLTVNEHYQTETPHIYAAGDVIGFPALAATSMEQGRLAACHMFGQLPVGDYEGRTELMPYGIYAIPEISMVGKSEEQLTKENIPYEVGLARYSEIARGQLISDPAGFLKLMFHPQSRRLLGVHAIGTGATEIIHIGQAVMSAGMPIDYFVETVFNYPTLAECYKVAAFDGLNRVRERPADAEPAEEPTYGPEKQAA